MKRSLILMPFLMLAGCGGAEDVPFIPPIDFANEAPIALNVASVQVVDDYVPPKTLPNVEHAAPTPPYRAVHMWADQRLRAVGATGYVRVDIKDASIVQKQLIGQVEYDGRLDVTIEASDGDDLASNAHTATAEIAVTRQIVTAKGDDLADKERIWDNLTREMMQDFDRGAASGIANDLGRFTGAPSATATTMPPPVTPDSDITAMPLEQNGASGNY